MPGPTYRLSHGAGRWGLVAMGLRRHGQQELQRVLWPWGSLLARPLGGAVTSSVSRPAEDGAAPLGCGRWTPS